MLIEFTVENYRSFKDATTFSMIKAPDKSKDPTRHPDNVFEVNKKLTLLKSAAIYGANASGKTNLLRAIDVMRDVVLESARESQTGDRIPLESFRLSTETESAPSCFEIIFWLDDRQYRYGFKADQERIHEEWLFHTRHRETNLFKRNGTEISMSKVFKEGRQLIDKTRPNALFLSVVAQFNGEISQRIFRWFGELDITPIGYPFRIVTRELLKDQTLSLKDIVGLIRPLDVGILDINMTHTTVSEEDFPEDMPLPLREFLLEHGEAEITRFGTFHNQYDKAQKPIKKINFDLTEHESAGTQKLFALTGLILANLKQGGILVIDELDTQLHPLITMELIKLFHSPSTNLNNAQLIFTTHDTNLLDPEMFRRDQIWFAEKNNCEATDLYSLVEFKGVPDDDDARFEDDYITGRYGAIPYIGNVNVWVNHAE